MTRGDKEKVVDFIYRFGTLEPDDANVNLKLEDVVSKDDMVKALDECDEHDWEKASRSVEYLQPIAEFYEEVDA